MKKITKAVIPAAGYGHHPVQIHKISQGYASS